MLDLADRAAPTRQHELDHTDHTDHTYQESIFPERSRSSRGNRSHRSSGRGVKRCTRPEEANIANHSDASCLPNLM